MLQRYPQKQTTAGTNPHLLPTSRAVARRQLASCLKCGATLTETPSLSHDPALADFLLCTHKTWALLLQVAIGGDSANCDKLLLSNFDFLGLEWQSISLIEAYILPLLASKAWVILVSSYPTTSTFVPEARHRPRPYGYHFKL